jgi:hypothetical protein
MGVEPVDMDDEQNDVQNSIHNTDGEYHATLVHSQKREITRAHDLVSNATRSCAR